MREGALVGVLTHPRCRATVRTDLERNVVQQADRVNASVYSLRCCPRLMSTPAHILCFGRNPLLLETRCAVLAKQYRVMSVESLEELAKVTSAVPFDLVLLCHTLSAEECRASTEIAHHRWPAAKVLALTSGGPGCKDSNTDLDLSCLEGPRALLRAVHDLTHESRMTTNSASI